jgi:hypothetical protein
MWDNITRMSISWALVISGTAHGLALSHDGSMERLVDAFESDLDFREFADNPTQWRPTRT